MKLFHGLFAALAGAQVVYGVTRPRRQERATRGLVGLMLATALAEAVGSRGWRRGALPLSAAGGIGFAAELVGVATGRPFGRYSYSGKLGPRIGGVPMLAAAAWATMARPAWIVAGTLSSSARTRVPLAAGALTAWDVFLDPRMVADGYWTWPQGGRYEGIPATNFAGWFATAAAVYGVWTWLDDGDEPGGEGAVALYAWTWLGETFANAFIWRRPLTAAAGGVAMGMFAAPALARR